MEQNRRSREKARQRNRHSGTVLHSLTKRISAGMDVCPRIDLAIEMLIIG